MPDLSRDGTLWCSGIAGAGFYGGDFVNDQPRVIAEVHPAGMRAFLNDEEAVTQFGDSQVLGVNCRTGARRVVDPWGASTVFAGGGQWAAFHLSPDPSDPPGTVMVRTSIGADKTKGVTGLRLKHAYVGANTGPLRNDCVGPDGSIAIKERYHSFGPWHLYAPDGTRSLLASGDAANIQLFGGARFIYREGWEWFGVGVPVPQPLTTVAWNLRMIETPEGWWIVYQAEDGRVLAHPNGVPTGLVLGGGGDAFGIDVARLADGRFRAIWANSEGESPLPPWRLVVAHFRLTDPRVDVSVSTPEVPRIDRACRVGFFEGFTEAPVAPAGLPGNCSLLVHYGPGKVPQAYDVVDLLTMRPIAVYLSGIPDEGDMNDLERRDRAAKVERPDLPTIGYWPRGVQAGRVPAVDIVGVEAYRLASEPLEVFEARVRAAVARCGRAAIIAQVYTSNALLTSNLASLVPVYARVARDLPQVEYVLGFSGSGRATGLQDHPEVLPLWQQLAASVRTPSIPPAPPPAPDPEPHPTPVPVPEAPVKIQLSMPAYVNWRWGGGQSLDPPTRPDDSDRRPFEFGRTTAAGDETCELVDLGGGEYAVRSPNGRSWLSVQKDGSLEERDASKEPGAWERFTLVDGVLTEKAKDGVTRAPVEFLP